MKQFAQNEEAVSPVIGVILMVAITVILAAVIAAFVFGMAGNMSSTKNVAATATQQGTTVIVTFQGGADAGDVKFLDWSVNGVNQTPLHPLKNVTGSSAQNSSGTNDKDHVVVTATFKDGAKQVILDTFV
ncbi:type IV pilin N-terminal domain-containing protein [Methanofollis sp. UBA420]|jgi:flagellin-like protein|uniref:type IV pilin N-terminal domain-containing protein n=1 Tax=Methanofollis sp. UBA420 TaxID=1915514 RepID=UPI00316AD275